MNRKPLFALLLIALSSMSSARAFANPRFAHAPPANTLLAEIEAEETDLERSFQQLGSSERLRRLDALSLRKLDLVATMLSTEVATAVATASSVAAAEGREQSQTELETIASLKREISAHFERYQALQDLYGTPKDFLRTAAYRAYVSRSLALLDYLRRETRSTRSRSIVDLAQAAWTAAPTLLALTTSPALRQSHDGFARLLKLIRRLTPIAIPAGIEWRRSEWIDIARNQRDAVTIVVMNHSERHLDNVVMATVMDQLPGHSAIIALAQGWSHDAVAERVMRNPSIISVGERNGIHYGGTTARVVNALRQGVRNLFLYPEGSTGGGIGELKPLAPGFSAKLLPTLLAEFRVNLLILTTLDTYRILGSLRSDQPSRVVVGPIIEHDSLSRMLADGPAAVDTFIRSTWVRNFATSDEKIFGQFRATELARFIRGQSAGFGPASCRDLFGPAVAR